MMNLFSIDFPYFLHLVTHLKNLERDGDPPKGSTSKITLFFSASSFKRSLQKSGRSKILI